MNSYIINKDNFNIEELETYNFRNEGIDNMSPQVLLFKYPQIILNLREIEVDQFNKYVIRREYSTKRGSIDIVCITNNADIILIETKLLRNPESHRTVVAQAIDYAKAFTEETLEMIKSKIEIDKLKFNDYMISSLNTNIINGNYKIIIVGDKIHPNILGMVESIHSAPHLSFSINMVQLNTFSINNEKIIINPEVVSRTKEIERNVITIEVLTKNKIKIDSAIPDKKIKNNRPKITAEEYLNNLSNEKFVKSIRALWKEFEKNGGEIYFGVVGFSGRLNVNGKLYSLMWVYNDRFGIISKKAKENYDIDDYYYNRYLDNLKKSQTIYDLTVGGNRVEILFDNIDLDDFKIYVKATIDLLKRLKLE